MNFSISGGGTLSQPHIVGSTILSPGGTDTIHVANNGETKDTITMTDASNSLCKAGCECDDRTDRYTHLNPQVTLTPATQSMAAGSSASLTASTSGFIGSTIKKDGYLLSRSETSGVSAARSPDSALNATSLTSSVTSSKEGTGTYVTEATGETTGQTIMSSSATVTCGGLVFAHWA